METLCDLRCILINVDNLPELVCSSSSLVENNLLSFVVCNSINSSAISEVDNVSALNLEVLPPSIVGSVNLESVGLSGIVNLNCIFVISVSDRQGFLAEIPNLLLSSISSLQSEDLV